MLRFALFCLLLLTAPLRAEQITVTGGAVRALALGVQPFAAEGPARARADEIAQVIINDLASTGLIAPQSLGASLRGWGESGVRSARSAGLSYLLTGRLAAQGGQITVDMRLWDAAAGTPLGEGVRFTAGANAWRRIAHKLADRAHLELLGASGPFDSRLAFIAESGPKDARRTQLALMDPDGFGARALTDGATLVLSPRFAPDGTRLVYVSYASGEPELRLLDLASGQGRRLAAAPSFAPRWSADGRAVLYSAIAGGNTDIYQVTLGGGAPVRLTFDPAIDTSPALSPDGRWLYFESDRAGGQQIFRKALPNGAVERISPKGGRHASPALSPDGTQIAFTRIAEGRFRIGVMQADGTKATLLTDGPHDEGASFAPNGRMLAFFRVTQGEGGAPYLFTLPLTGGGAAALPYGGMGSDPDWSALLQ